MKTIIAGSRTATLPVTLEAGRQCPWKITEIVSGTARGADRCGEELARQYNIPLKQFPADWDTHGKKAGYLRNTQMAQYADAALIVWDGVSRGTRHMVDEAIRLQLSVSIWVFHHDFIDPRNNYILGDWCPGQPIPTH